MADINLPSFKLHKRTALSHPDENKIQPAGSAQQLVTLCLCPSSTEILKYNRYNTKYKKKQKLNCKLRK